MAGASIRGGDHVRLSPNPVPKSPERLPILYVSPCKKLVDALGILITTGFPNATEVGLTVGCVALGIVVNVNVREVVIVPAS